MRRTRAFEVPGRARYSKDQRRITRDERIGGVNPSVAPCMSQRRDNRGAARQFSRSAGVLPYDEIMIATCLRIVVNPS